MPWSKDNRPPHYLLPITRSFRDDWERLCKVAVSSGESRAALVRKAIREIYGEKKP